MGGRFCSLDQTHLESKSTLAKITLFSPKLGEDQKKKKKNGLRRKFEVFFFLEINFSRTFVV